MSYINSMSYSFCSSELNWTIYICPVISTLHLKCYPQLQSQNDISLAYSSFKGFEAARCLTKHLTLSYFRSLFNDHKRPLYYVTRSYFIEIISKNISELASDLLL
jgi:uncharacterized protein YfbU (UPF0304 family)